MKQYEEYQSIEVTREGDVLVLTLDRPENLNTMNAAMHTELSSIFYDIAQDDDTQAVVLTGRGRAFSAGGDLDWIAGLSPSEFDHCIAEGRRIVQGMLSLPQPIISAINGHSMGLATTIAILCDISYAANDAMLGDPHVMVGLVPGDGALIAWPWHVGMAKAKYHLMSGAPIRAQDAADMGLITGAVPPDEVLPVAMALAAKLAGLPSVGVRGVKTVLNTLLGQAANVTLDLGLALEKQSSADHEHKETLARFRAEIRSSKKADKAEAVR
jgi:enoyl-CoA hydratase